MEGWQILVAGAQTKHRWMCKAGLFASLTIAGRISYLLIKKNDPGAGSVAIIFMGVYLLRGWRHWRFLMERNVLRNL